MRYRDEESNPATRLSLTLSRHVAARRRVWNNLQISFWHGLVQLKQNPYESPTNPTDADSTSAETPNAIKTFVRGGIGCLGAFLLFGIFAVFFGGSVSIYAGTPAVLYGGAIKINFVGVLIVFVIGGLSWLTYSHSRKPKLDPAQNLDNETGNR